MKLKKLKKILLYILSLGHPDKRKLQSKCVAGQIDNLVGSYWARSFKILHILCLLGKRYFEA